ncbi:hypothetical protein [Mycolicibacterium fortuitum]|uniref:hypothetical protein n=1 Tax=Mycolicibacterium fortuitum TaxID=1766 RepID=UPI001CDBE0C9|nr:hypothetical protein [Mycolicibacterium fortuitum]UBV14893.1 hypothetical protein H8Z57_30110 [Mycolicibacterium fortuitum]
MTRDLALDDRAVALEQHLERLSKGEGSHRAERAVLTAELAVVQGAISVQKRAQFLREMGIDPMLTDHDVTRQVYQRAGLPQPSEAALVAAYGTRPGAPTPPTIAKGHAPDLRVSPVSGNIGALPGEPKELLRMHKRRDLIASTPSHNPETLRRLDARIAAAEAKSKVHQAHRAQSLTPAPASVKAAPASAPVNADLAPKPTEPRVGVPLTPPLAPPTTVPVTAPMSVDVPPVSTNVPPTSTPPAATAPTSTATNGEGHTAASKGRDVVPEQQESRHSAPSAEVVDANRQRVNALVESLKASGQDDETTSAQIAAVRDAEPSDSPLRVALTEAWEALTPHVESKGHAPDLRVSRITQLPQFIAPVGGGSPFDALMAQMSEQERQAALARVRAQMDADEHTSSSFAHAVADLDE